MSPVTEIKRLLIRALGRLQNTPCADALVDEAARRGVLPRPLQSDINEAKRELEADGYIQGSRDEFDHSLTWTLTDKGCHKARQLG